MKTLKNSNSFIINELRKFAISMRRVGLTDKHSPTRKAKPLILAIMILFITTMCSAETIITECSFYSKASCVREGTWQKYGGRYADGTRADSIDTDLVVASWDFEFGNRLLVTNLANGKSVRVICRDRGPSKRLYKKGRRADLSKGAFSKIADCKSGVIQVRIERIG